MNALTFAESYLLNSLWQAPLLCGIGWAAARLARRIGVQAEHRVWVSVQLLSAVLPAASSMPGPWHGWSLPWFAHGYGMEGGSVSVQMGIGTTTLANRWSHVALLSAVALYALVTLFLCLRYMWRLKTANALSRRTESAFIPVHVERIWLECCERLRVQDATLVIADGIFAPLTCGVMRKVVLLPLRKADALSARELRAAISHELAHVRRNDFALNLLYEFLALPVSYHPAMWAIRQRTIESREMICDAAAAELWGAMEYGQSLLSLAAQLMKGAPMRYPHAIGVFDANTLERRVMRLKSNVVLQSGVRRNVMALACALLLGAATAAAVPAGWHPGEPGAAAAEGAARRTVSPSEMTDLLISHVNPRYPPEAKKAGIQGTVVLRAVIATDGTVDQLTVLSGPKELQQSSLDAVRLWRYKPYIVDGQPVEVETTVNVIYSLAK